MPEGFFSGLFFILLLLIAITAILSSIETAIFSLQPFQVRRLKNRNRVLGEALEKLMENPRRLLSTILLADALTNLPLMILCLYLLREVTPRLLPFWAEALTIFAVIVFLGDLLPKLVALNQPYRVAKYGVAIMRWLMPLCHPVARFLQNLSESVAALVIKNKSQTTNVLSEEELETLVQISAEEGALNAVEGELIQEIIKLGGKTIRDCMTPRIEAYTIPDDWTNDKAIAELRSRRYARVPVYADTPDNILGVLDVKQFLFDPTQHYTEIMSPPSFVPETMKALDLLRSFLTHPQGMAIIVDEYGGTEGIITLSDFIEEVISDAVPTAQRELYIETIDKGRLIVNGSARLDDLHEYTGVVFDADGIDTIAGLIFNQLGHLPKPGTTLEMHGLSLTIRKTSRKRVEEVLIVLPELQEPTEDEA